MRSAASNGALSAVLCFLLHMLPPSKHLLDLQAQLESRAMRVALALAASTFGLTAIFFLPTAFTGEPTGALASGLCGVISWQLWRRQRWAIIAATVANITALAMWCSWFLFDLIHDPDQPAFVGKFVGGIASYVALSALLFMLLRWRRVYAQFVEETARRASVEGRIARAHARIAARASDSSGPDAA